jgi:hypothetical protein
MILGYDKGTEEGVIWGKYTYICGQRQNFELVVHLVDTFLTGIV